MPCAIKRRHAGEALLVVLLLAIVWRSGGTRLENWNGPAGSLTNDLFIPAIMMNAGRGFSNTDAAQIPQLRAFLDFQIQSFDTGLIPDDVALCPLHPYQEFHRYLIYSTAVVWGLCGVTWDAVKLLLLVYFFLACLIVYAISRLAINSLFSFLVAASFAHALPVLWTLPVLRDFAKAPFILAVALLLGILAFRALSVRKFLGVAVILGLLLGIGMGVRRDMMVFLPISLLFLFVGKSTFSKNATGIRCFAVILLLTTYALAGWPVHRSLAREGYLAAHDTIMGFSSFSDHELGVIRPASYEKHYLLNDMYSTIQAHYAAALGETFPEDTYTARVYESAFDFDMKRAYVMAIVTKFPADMLARAYAAVLRTITGIVARPLGVEKYGLWFVAAGLLFIASRSMINAWLVLIMLCYFCGYTSLQFAIRHAFHTSFIPYFFLGFVVHHAGKACYQFCRVGAEERSRALALLRRGFARAIAWGGITAILFYAPLWSARHIQQSAVRALRQSYVASSLEPAPHKTLVWDGRVLFAPATTSRAEDFDVQGLLADFDTGVLVALFDDADKAREVRVVYEWEGGIGDFGGPVNVATAGNHYCGGAKLYFPVYEKNTSGGDWSRFLGLSMSNEAALSFRGFSKVQKIKPLGVLMNMLIPDEAECFRFHQRLSIPLRGAPWSPYPSGAGFELLRQITETKEKIEAGEHDRAVASASKMIKRYQGSITVTLLLAEALEKAGRMEETVGALIDLARAFPNVSVVYKRVDIYLGKHGGAERRAAVWATVLERAPECVQAAQYLERAARELETAETQSINSAV